MAGFLDLLRDEIVLGDGALGTLLHRRGQPLNACCGAPNLAPPEVVHQIHCEYPDAAVGLIESSPFGAGSGGPLTFDLTVALSRHAREQERRSA